MKSRPKKRTNRPWTKEEESWLDNRVYSDFGISKKINRSVQAIQQRRYLLKFINR